jgi:hypothetical protein
MSLPIDSLQNCISYVLDQWLEDKALEYFVPLLCQRGEGIDFHIESVQVLKEALHPSHHDSVICPFLLK